ncbi:hypothetical protein HK104_007749 [Borealophlyctis nickersoniae]|nr:hypothetical protein HK104_007749 [Borealophlyctis nickersoniae]
MDLQEQKRKLLSGHRALVTATVASIRDSLIAKAIHNPEQDPSLKLLWEALFQPQPLPLLVSAASDAVVSLVRAGTLPWLAGLDGILNGLPAAPKTHLPALVRGIAQLLVLHVKGFPVENYVSPFGLRAPPRLHPLIAVVSSRRDAVGLVLAELPRIADNAAGRDEQRQVILLKMLVPFVQFMIFDNALRPENGQGIHVTALLRWLGSWVSGLESPTPSLHHEYLSLLLDVFNSLPVSPEDDGVMQMQLMDSIKPLLSTVQQSGRRRVLFAYLNRACDMRRASCSLASLLDALHKVVTETDSILRDSATCVVLAATIAYLLLDVYDVDEERTLLLDILLHVVRSTDVDSPHMLVGLRMVMHSLLQTVAESQSETARGRAYDIIVILERAVIRNPGGGDVSLEELRAEIRLIEANGLFALLLVHLTSLFKQFATPSALSTAFSSSAPHFTMLFLSALLFHPSQSVRSNALKEIVSTCQAYGPTCLTLLPTLLYILRTDPSPEIQLQVILHCLPTLTTSNDAFVTARALRIVMTMLGHAETPAGALTTVGVRAMFEIWKRQPRVWTHLRGWISGWAKQRRYGRGVKGRKGGFEKMEVELEIAVMMTLRDICGLKAADYGQDLLPLLISLMQVQDLQVSSLCFAIESINKCIEADVTDPRAVWNVFMRQFVVGLGDKAPGQVLVKICQYFALVPAKEDATDVYMAFKGEILPHLFPLTGHEDPTIADAAYAALSAFPAPDLFSLIPSPVELVTSIVSNENPPPSTALFLATLIKHECKHMRRAVFKGLAASAGARVGEARQEGEPPERVALTKVVRDVVDNIRKQWEGGRAAAGIRSGLAAAVLFSPSDPTIAKPALSDDFTLTKLPFYRAMTNALRDLSVTDHVVFRIDVLSAWTCFWENALADVYHATEERKEGEAIAVEGEEERKRRAARVDQVVTLVVKDLVEKRLKESRLLSLSVNILLSLTGLVLAASNLSLPSAGDRATAVVDMLLKDYVSSTSDTAAAEWNDDVYFAVYMALGSLVKALHPNDEQRTGAIIEALFIGLGRPSSEGQDWSQFAAGYGVTQVYAALVASSSLSAEPLLLRIAAGCLDLSANVVANARFGAAIGFAGTLPIIIGGGGDEARLVVGEIVNAHVALVERFTDSGVVEGQVGAARLQGAAWIVAAAAAAGWLDDRKEHVQELLANAMGATASKREWESLHSHYLLSYTYLFQPSLSQTDLATQTDDLLALISQGNVPSFRRVASLLAIAALLGLPYGKETSLDPNLTVIRRVIDALRSVALSQEPKVARVAGWVLGKAIFAAEQTRRLTIVVEGDSGGRREKDPTGYGRLNVSASYLRAVFERLSGKDPTSTPATAHVLLTSLIEADMTLPPVDWASVIQQLCAMSSTTYDLTLSCFLLASRQACASSAKSLVDHFVAVLDGVASHGTQPEPGWWRDTVASDSSLGKLLELGGLRKGDLDSDTKAGAQERVTVVVAPSKVLAVFKGLVDWVFKGSGDAKQEVVQLAFVRTALPYLTLSSSGSTAGSGSSAFLRTDLLRVLLDAYARLHSGDLTETSITTIRVLVSILASEPGSTVGLIATLPGSAYGAHESLRGSKPRWTPKTVWTLSRLVELAISSDEYPWVREAVAGAFDPSGSQAAVTAVKSENIDNVIVRLVRETVSASMKSAMEAVLTSLAVRAEGGNSAEGARWIVRMLDVMIVLCAATADGAQSAASGLDAAWERGIGGVIGLWWGSLTSRLVKPAEEAIAPDASPRVVNVTEERWRTLELEGILLLPEIVNALKTETLTRQIIKRLIRLLECTTITTAGPSNRGRIVISRPCREAMRHVLMGLREHEDVLEGWVEVVQH